MDHHFRRLETRGHRLETGGHRLETRGYRLETKEVTGWKQKRQNLRRKFPAAKIKREKKIKMISDHSPGPPKPYVKLYFFHHVPL